MQRTISHIDDPPRLEVVARVRDHQRAWLELTRERALQGEAFAICNADEFEELLSAMDIPVLVINPWNFLIVAQGKAAHFNSVLERRGYAGPHFFALGLASTMEPEEAPRGGLPRPAFVLGTTRSEAELRVTELWAREFDVPCIPLEFNLATPAKTLPGPGWWRLTRDHWPELSDPPRLELRLEQVRAALARIESITGKALSFERLAETMELVNAQVDLLSEVRDLIGRAPVCPVSVRDQLSLYQPMWHRGTPSATELFTAYRDEVLDRVEHGVGAYAREDHRLFYASMQEDPPFHAFLRAEFGAALVGTPYLPAALTYARTVHDDDPLRALVARQLFLFAYTPDWLVNEAEFLRCDGVVTVEPASEHPSALARACEAAGLPLVSVPSTADTEETRARLREYFRRLG
ncbi:MAG TPA: 2-hydroxyacyl-CoA dehydratase family protein [Solirubrobacteraceae bacterium]|nr:2-hydroxyacyl-CoA dehydratase family protein [Solirubrobacteraceae bacterium]